MMMMKKIKLLLFAIFPFLGFLFISPVKAATLTQETGVGYYLSSNPNNRVWSTYSTNTSYSFSSLADIDTVNSRFRYTGGFIKDYTYVITYRITNNYTYSGGDDFLTDWLGLVDTNLGCYYTSSSSVQYTSCFTNLEPISVSQFSTNSITITLTFTPIRDLYQIIYRNELSTSYGSPFSSNGFTISNRTISVVQSSAGAIIDNQNQNTDNIINNQNSNTQDIIDNQNSNTQAIIDSNKSCQFIDKNNISVDGSYLSSSGNILSSSGFGITSYYNLTNSTVEILSPIQFNPGVYLCYYNANKNLISCVNEYNVTSLDIPVNASYIRFSIAKSSNKPTAKICTTGTQAITDSITDNTPPDTNELSNASGWLPPGPVDSILNLPLTLLQSLNNAFSSNSCQPININLPYVNAPITIPCMSTVWEGFGLLPLFTWIGRVLGGVLLYKYLIGLYKWVDDTLTMRENNNFDDGSLG